ncbi:torsin interacting protein [Halictus rubicundus]|uniref:torsin interacting protein n=1 Tax=Halictus rubicundus TaxID=77578 RepID=UPI004035F853
MNDFDLNASVELSKPPVPRARQALREHNVSSEKITYRLNNSDGALITKRMQDIKEQTKHFLDHANDYDEYTDDEDDDQVENNESFRHFSRSFTPECSSSSACNSSLTTQVRERSYRSLNTSRSVNTTNSSQSQTQLHIHHKKSCISLCNFFVFSTITAIILCTMFNIIPIHETTQEKNISEVNETSTVDLVAVDKLLDESMQIIRAQFHHQKPTIWNDIASGIYDVAMYPQKPTIIILFGNEADTLNCMAQMVGELSSTVLGSNDYLTLTPADFPNDVGTTIYNLRGKIAQKKVVIVQDLLNVNAEAMKAFHNFCDRQNPLIKKAIYIMTMIVDGYKPFQNELRFVDTQLSNKLSGKIDKDILHPLITRLTDGVIIPVLPESEKNSNSEFGIQNSDKTVCTLSTPPNKRL